MKTSGILAALAALGATSVLATPVDGMVVIKRDNLPGLNDVQSANARAVIDENNKEKLGKQGCIAALTTGLTESSLRILANNGVPASLNYKHDGLGSDHDSIGIFQQRASIYTNIECDMGAACSASQFFKGMTAVSGWETMDVATLCQKVQRSAFPDAYKKWVGTATDACAAAGV
ncbi:NLP/P60 protein [Pochonia chlamydosporia 170]|uniref:NLP/P60 protein n=1 Tax=Pochonia chlamydosporia 170 TaxID=1380566 RepID=A0A179FEB3_METCM|nr:NLP/P60 protein [Pochonia chlamydosporia 170]OAQ63650.1 NLP/P60 protein [Pochonia chlamydosporia 170]